MLELAAEPGPSGPTDGARGSPGNAPPRGVGAPALCRGRGAQVPAGLGDTGPLGLGDRGQALGENEPSPAGQLWPGNAVG